MSYKIKQKFKKGAASFYIVAFSTLILLIVATSFAAVIISEIERTSNDDLSQSAYDSALAGVEDAKLAFYNYRNCMAQPEAEREPNCKNVINYMKNANCDMVGNILGRTIEDRGVLLKESRARNGENNMQQAYTCVRVKTTLDNYKSTLSSSVQTKAVKLKFADEVKADDISTVTVSWYSDEDSTDYRYNNFMGGKVTFNSLRNTLYAIPPTISVSLVQTQKDFRFDEFDMTRGSQTDRGMVYLVPTSSNIPRSSDDPNKAESDSYRRAWTGAGGTGNYIDEKAMLWSNDKTVTHQNLPYTVYCQQNAGKDYACSATIKLPKPIGETRSDDTFMVAVSLPYGAPATSFMLEFDTALERDVPVACENPADCVDESGAALTERTTRARLDGVQVEVDSTGRANDLYRRVETRLEAAGNDGNLITMGPLELTGNQSGGSGSSDTAVLLDKKFVVKCEYQFGQTCP